QHHRQRGQGDGPSAAEFPRLHPAHNVIEGDGDHHRSDGERQGEASLEDEEHHRGGGHDREADGESRPECHLRAHGVNLALPMATGKDRSPCARCAEALGRSCCQPGPGERLATLTASDVTRIQAATGWRRDRFVESEPLTAEEALAYEARRPRYRGYFRR